MLVLRMDNLGDVIMLAPALRALKENSPQARLTLLASPGGSKAAALLPWIDETLAWRASWQDVGNGPPDMDGERELDLVRMLRAHSFDAALIFTSFSQTAHIPGYVCYLAGIPLRAGASKEFGGRVLSSALQGTPTRLHQVERNLRLIEHLGFVVRDRHLALEILPAQRAAATALLAQAGLDPVLPFLLVHPGASASARRYPAQRFGEVVCLLREQGWQVLVTGVEREQEIMTDIQRVAPGVPMLLQVSLAEYTALIERAALVLCNNTLPLHLADAVSTPVVALFSGTDYEDQWRPRRVPVRLLRRVTPCAPCYRFACPIGLPCLDIEPHEVVATILDLSRRSVAEASVFIDAQER